jgi:Predicted AAA-ATPase/PD-(D/E)XK nuclease superfamily
MSALMNPPRKVLPIGIESFANIRRGNFYYVDKTEFAWHLTQEAGRYFLSRPRRFGKSLFLDTLRELFEGNQALFQGLFIHDKWDWTRRFPVVRISFSGGVLTSRAALDQKIQEILTDNQQRLGVVCTHQSVSGQFLQLIQLAHEKFGEPVVFLVDEYDKPILDNIENSATALAMREGLKDIYSVIKEADEHIRLAFLTGVSKFSKVNLFSGMNNLRDITLSEKYSALCGYTDADVDTVFADQLPGLDRAQIRRWYNGYNWTGTSVYNPFDLLLLFEERRFAAWWCSTGTPTFLFKMMQQKGFFTPTLTKLRAGSELISALDVDLMTPEALLFQTGYLTIHQTKLSLSGKSTFTLGYPNQEVEQSLNASLLANWTGDAGRAEALRERLEDLLISNDLMAMRELFQSFFASIPHQWYTNNNIDQYEGFYASVFYSYFAALGLDTRVEDATNLGRIDLTLIVCGRIYLFEFKVVESAPAGRALQQIKDKGYAEKYRVQGLPIYLVGVEFSKQQRNVVGFEVELLA